MVANGHAGRGESGWAIVADDRGVEGPPVPPSHRSFREIAAQLGVSANTVRTRPTPSTASWARLRDQRPSPAPWTPGCSVNEGHSRRPARYPGPAPVAVRWRPPAPSRRPGRLQLERLQPCHRQHRWRMRDPRPSAAIPSKCRGRAAPPGEPTTSFVDRAPAPAPVPCHW